MKNCGFNPENQGNILEIVQSVPTSLSRYLKEYEQFLLSERVRYDELEDFGIKGARGKITGYGCDVPKTLEADSYFAYNSPKVPYVRHGYSIPSIHDIDTIIAMNDFSTEMFQQLDVISRNFFKNQYDEYVKLYIGTVIDLTDGSQFVETGKTFALASLLNYRHSDKIKLLQDTVDNKSKQLLLITNK